MIFFTVNHYFSDPYQKKSYRSLSNINNKIKVYSQNLITLEEDTLNIIEYVNSPQTKNKKKYYFWELLDKNE